MPINKHLNNNINLISYYNIKVNICIENKIKSSIRNKIPTNIVIYKQIELELSNK